MNRKRKKVGRNNCDIYKVEIFCMMDSKLLEIGNRNRFGNEPVEKKIRRFTIKRDVYEPRIRRELSKKHFNFLYSVFKRYFDWKEKLSKVHVVDSLVSKFYGEDSDFEKRKLENVNIQIYEKDSNFEDFRFTSMCRTEIPHDILSHILSFLKSDLDLLLSVGRCCKSMYYSVLSTWKEVRVSKRNLFQISLLILRSVRKIILLERRVTSKFTRKEFEYLTEKLNYDGRIKEIEFITTPTQLENMLRILSSLLEKKKYHPFRNVEVVYCRLRGSEHFEYSEGHLSKQSSLMSTLSIKNHELFKTLFPNIRRLVDPYSLEMCESLPKLEKLELSFHTEKLWRQYSIGRIVRFVSPITLRSLKLRDLTRTYHHHSRPYLSKKEFLVGICSHFTSLEELTIEVSHDYLSHVLRHLRLNNLKKLHLYEGVLEFGRRTTKRKFDITRPNKIFFRNPEFIEDLKIVSFERLFLFQFLPTDSFSVDFPNLTRFVGGFTLGVYRDVAQREKQEELENEFVDHLFEEVVKKYEIFEVDLINDMPRTETNFRFLGEILRIRYEKKNKRLILGFMKMSKLSGENDHDHNNSSSSSTRRRRRRRSKRRSKRWFRDYEEKMTRTRCLFEKVKTKLSDHMDWIEDVKYLTIVENYEGSEEERLGCFWLSKVERERKDYFTRGFLEKYFEIRRIICCEDINDMGVNVFLKYYGTNQ